VRGRNKDLSACISILRKLQACGGPDPGHKEKFDRAIAALMKLRRSPNPSKREVFRAVRIVAETICNT
jgi:hypothetical protein